MAVWSQFQSPMVSGLAYMACDKTVLLQL